MYVSRATIEILEGYLAGIVGTLILTLVISSCLVYGIRKSKPTFILPWLIYEMIILIVSR